MKIKSIVRLSQSFRHDQREFSLSVAYGHLRRDLPIADWAARRTIYENSILHYLRRQYGHLLAPVPEQPRAAGSAGNDHIWVMWWGGEAQMLPIVRACYSRLVSLTREKQLVLITKENWNRYIDLPDFILEKLDKGFLTVTHFSDIVRIELLKKYGGLWIDATVYLDHLPGEIFESEIYTLHAPGLFPEFISRGSWSTYFLYAKNSGEPLFAKLSKLWHEYWREHNAVIDYLLIDYWIKMVVDSDADILRQIEVNPKNPHHYLLKGKLNEAYTVEKMTEIIQSSPIQKLSYKGTLSRTASNGSSTMYAHLIGDE